MPAYLTITEFRNLSTMSGAAVDELEDLIAPGFLAAQIEMASAWVDARLAKRYEAPFSSPYPLAVRMWVARLVTPRAMQRRGVDPNDEQYSDIRDDAKAAADEIKEAADSEVGMFDLPLRADTSKSGISRGGPFGYSEASPYVGFDEQARRGRAEDRSGGGTYG